MAFARHLIDVDLFTDAYRVSGKVAVGTGGIHSELGDPSSDFLELKQAYVSRIHQPGDIVASYGQAAFRKNSINFILLNDRRDGIPTGSAHGPSVFTRGRPTPVFLTVPSFEIHGEIMYDGKATPGAVLVHSIGRFHPIFDADAAASLYPEISYSGDLILVHKERIGIFCLNTSS